MANEKNTCQAAVFCETGQPLELRTFRLPERLGPGAALCRVRLATICGSDLHTVAGRRNEPAPLILGHEIVGDVVALGDGLTDDGFGQPLRVGDRVSWSIAASCGSCFYCRHGLPQKCVRLRKYGHACCDEAPHLTGGFAEYVCLLPGTAVFRVPEGLSDEVAAPANCALATVVNAVETIGVRAGEVVLIQGAGLLGLNLIALCREAGAQKVIVTDVSGPRLAFAERFGADVCLNPAQRPAEELMEAVHRLTDGRGADAAFEVCGDPAAAELALRALRIGGRCLIAGLVAPGKELRLDGNTLTRRCLTIKGIHNYAPEHLGPALRFLEAHAAGYPYADVVGKTFPLERINEAMREAATGDHIRVGVGVR